MSNLVKLQSLCVEQGFDALLITGDINRFYVTDLHTSAGLVLLSASNAIFMTDFRYIEAARSRLNGFDLCMVTKNEGDTYEDIVSGLLKEWNAKVVGFEECVSTVKQHRRWAEKLNVEWKPADTGISRIRAVKEDWEIERMTRAQRIAERAFEDVVSCISVGMTERQIAAELVYGMLKGGGERTSFNPIVVSGPNSALPHGEPGDRPIRPGDFLTMDFGCVADGYCSDMTRTVAVGYADDEMRKVYQTVLDAQIAGIAAAKAGVAGSEVHIAASRVIENAGYGEFFGHGFGHGIGMEVHEEFGAYPSENRVLPVGAVISAEPGIYLPGRFGVRIEDCLVLSESGNINLTTTPKTLRVICE